MAVMWPILLFDKYSWKMRKTILFLAAALVGTSAITARQMTIDNKLRYAGKIVESFYVDSINSDSIAEEAIRAMLKTLDPHSQYSDQEETRELTEPLQGNFSGIGIQFNMLNDTLYVIQPVAGGPSEKVGILAGDRILSANDTLISGVKKKNADIIKILRGEKGSKVNVKVLRPGQKDVIDFRITRADIPIYSVDASYMAAPGVGYVKISRFAGKTAEEVRDAVKELKKQGMKDLIIDLEYNGGGYLNAATELAEMLLNTDDMIVYTKGDKSPYKEYRAGAVKRLTDGKIVIMVDQYSASASEILSGAVQDNDRGLIVGRRTFGKGLVQRPFPFPDGSMIRLTVARYYTPSGRCIQKPYADGEDAYENDILNRLNSGELTNADSVHVNAAEQYKTLRNGRTVYGGGGVMPDLFVALDTTGTSSYSRDLLAKGVYNSFCVNYIDQHRKELKKLYKNEDLFVEKFTVDDQLLGQFRDYAAKEGVEFNQEGYEKALPTIKSIVKAIIGRDLFTQSTYYRVVNEDNKVYQQALRLISDDNEYNRLLNKN